MGRFGMCDLYQSVRSQRYLQCPPGMLKPDKRCIRVFVQVFRHRTLTLDAGSSLALDLCSVLMLPSRTRRWSFISQALGLMVDLDIGTENLRWMGDTRFVLGFLKGVVSSKNFRARIRMDVVESNKVEMARIARERSHVPPATMGKGHDPLRPKSKNGEKKNGKDGKSNAGDSEHASTSHSAHTEPIVGSNKNHTHPENGDGNGKESKELDDGPLPDASPLEPTEKWVTVDSGTKRTEATIDGNPTSILYFYAGMMPWVSRDLNQWPVATVNQGVVDVAIQRVVCPPPPHALSPYSSTGDKVDER